MEAKVFERMAELDSTHWWFVARRNILKSVIQRIVRPPAKARILEIGCGTGHNLAMLGEFGHVEASELDPTARKLAAKRLGRKVEAAALPDLSAFPEASYDLVALLDVLEHVADDRAALAAIRTRLKPGGKLLVTVPGQPVDVDRARRRPPPSPPLHQEPVGEGSTRRRLRDRPAVAVQHDPVPADRCGPGGGQSHRPGKRRRCDAACKPLNKLFQGLFGLESGLIGRLPMPFGVSLVAVVRRTD